jgi:hypothetical protein
MYVGFSPARRFLDGYWMKNKYNIATSLNFFYRY